MGKPELRQAEGAERDEVLLMVELLRMSTLPFVATGDANDTTKLMCACATFAGSLWGTLQMVMDTEISDDDVAQSFARNFLQGIKVGHARAARFIRTADAAEGVGKA